MDSQIKNKTMAKDASAGVNFLTKKAPYKGPGAESEEKREPAGDVEACTGEQSESA